MTSESALIARAERRAARRLGFYIHATVFVLVNLALFAINFTITPGRPWAVFPFVGWGIGLLMHGMAVLGPLGYLYRALVERELARMPAGRDAAE